MKRLTIVVAAMVASLLVLRPPLYAQNEGGNPAMGGAANEAGPDNGDQPATPDQQPGGGDEAAEQNNDPNAGDQNDQTNQNDQADQNGQNDQNDQNDNNQADTGASGDANFAYRQTIPEM